MILKLFARQILTLNNFQGLKSDSHGLFKVDLFSRTFQESPNFQVLFKPTCTNCIHGQKYKEIDEEQ